MIIINQDSRLIVRSLVIIVFVVLSTRRAVD